MTSEDETSDSKRQGPVDPTILATLVENHREFLAFLERRVGNRELAEDLLQDAFVRGIDRIGTLREPDSARAWFYRTLRNAIVDAQRKRGANDRRLEVLRLALEDAATPDADLDHAICLCVSRIASTLKPEYASVLERVEIEGASLGEFAAEAGISETNAGVRAFRARAALRREVARSCGTCAEHGCFDCSCGRLGS